MPDEATQTVPTVETPAEATAPTNANVDDPEPSEVGAEAGDTPGDEVPETDGKEADSKPAADDPEEEEDFKVPDIDKAITEALKDHPEALRAVQDRWRLAWRGIEKREARAEAATMHLQGIEPEQAGHLIQYWNRLGNPETGPTVVKDLLNRMSEQFGIPVHELAGVDASEPVFRDEHGNEIEEWEHDGFDSKGQWLLYKEQKRSNELLAASKEPTKPEASVQEKGDGNAGYAAVAAKIKGEKAGFILTPEMYAEARRELPQFRDDPAKAVRRWFGEEIEAHVLKVQAKSRKVGHNMPTDRAQGKGAPPHTPGKPLTAADVRRRLEQQGKL